ncbi:glycosyltransferase family 4 protein [Melioribacter sp. OK-6-Me]|uniref:glycosyltransferase family 4 protein n=1 Tax=Melioribacter sp. OK-6-Me TaxID=3423433 RepID=UPI003ED8ED9D
MNKIFVTYFPNYSDIHLFKDPGQIPFRFRKTLGYDSYIITNESCEKLKETKEYLKIICLPKNKIVRYFKLILFFLKTRGRLQIFNIFHIGFHNIFVALLCKLFVHDVFIYLKMDNCNYTGPYPWEKIFDKKIIPAMVFEENKRVSFGQRIKNFLLKNYLIHIVDLFSVEDEESKIFYENKYPFFKNKIIIVYNGHVVDLFENKSRQHGAKKKDNIILNVGNLGTYSKATDLLLESFAKIRENHNWELHFAGTIDEKFKSYLEDYFIQYPELKSRIHFHGHIDKIKLFQLYQKARIFCLPSRYEGFANVFSEAMYFRNAIITTKYVSPRKIIENKAGIIIEKDDPKALANALKYLINNPHLIEKYGEYGHQFAKDKLNWDNIVKKLHQEMVERGLITES